MFYSRQDSVRVRFAAPTTLIWGVIRGHLAVNKMLVKYIKYHPIVDGAYSQCLVSNSRIKEAMEANIMSTKLKYKVYEISSSTTSASKSINELKTSVASVKKSANTTISKIGSLIKK